MYQLAKPFELKTQINHASPRPQNMKAYEIEINVEKLHTSACFIDLFNCSNHFDIVNESIIRQIKLSTLFKKKKDRLPQTLCRHGLGQRSNR